MSDRRSFSEIPRDLLREQGHEDRIDRVWRRLEAELVSGPRPRRLPPSVFAAGIAAVTFVMGVAVGARWFAEAPAPAPLFAAEPEMPRLRAETGEARPSAAPAAVPRGREVRPTHRVAVPRRSEAVAPVPAEQIEAPVQLPSVDWRRLADDGHYAEALAALDANGGFDSALTDATADQLMSLVDVARATGQRDRALVALRRIVSEHGADPNAPVAAWMLGNELVKAQDFASAEQAFAMYRALSPGGDFAEDALARQIDMAVEQGHTDHARKLAGQYIKEFPDGPRTAEIQAELDAWSREPAASAPPSDPAPRAQALPDAGAAR